MMTELWLLAAAFYLAGAYCARDLDPSEGFWTYYFYVPGIWVIDHLADQGGDPDAE